MPAKSQAQQKFFAIVKNYQQGKMKNASPAVKKLANSMNNCFRLIHLYVDNSYIFCIFIYNYIKNHSIL